MADPVLPRGEDDYQPPTQSGGPPTAPHESGIALASLVCGLLCCVTPIPPLLAVIFGIQGIRQTRNPAIGGRSRAVIGLSLGLIGLAVWALVSSGFGALLWFFFSEKSEAEKVAETFIQSVVDGNLDEALKLAEPEVERAKLATFHERMKPWGPLSHTRLDYPAAQNLPNASNSFRLRWIFDGRLIFSRATPEFSISVITEDSGYKVERFEMKQQ